VTDDSTQWWGFVENARRGAPLHRIIDSDDYLLGESACRGREGSGNKGNTKNWGTEHRRCAACVDYTFQEDADREAARCEKAERDVDDTSDIHARWALGYKSCLHIFPSDGPSLCGTIARTVSSPLYAVREGWGEGAILCGPCRDLEDTIRRDAEAALIPPVWLQRDGMVPLEDYVLSQRYSATSVITQATRDYLRGDLATFLEAFLEGLAEHIEEVNRVSTLAGSDYASYEEGKFDAFQEALSDIRTYLRQEQP
jgi:hypothetical protein